MACSWVRYDISLIGKALKNNVENICTSCYQDQYTSPYYLHAILSIQALRIVSLPALNLANYLRKLLCKEHIMQISIVILWKT